MTKPKPDTINERLERLERTVFAPMKPMPTIADTVKDCIAWFVVKACPWLLGLPVVALAVWSWCKVSWSKVEAGTESMWVAGSVIVSTCVIGGCVLMGLFQLVEWAIDRCNDGDN